MQNFLFRDAKVTPELEAQPENYGIAPRQHMSLIICAHKYRFHVGVPEVFYS